MDENFGDLGQVAITVGERVDHSPEDFALGCFGGLHDSTFDIVVNLLAVFAPDFELVVALVAEVEGVDDHRSDGDDAWVGST